VREGFGQELPARELEVPVSLVPPPFRPSSPVEGSRTHGDPVSGPKRGMVSTGSLKGGTGKYRGARRLSNTHLVEAGVRTGHRVAQEVHEPHAGQQLLDGRCGGAEPLRVGGRLLHRDDVLRAHG
jgi:hypothetical protein